ncbi:protein phosphatase 2C domain-containing protein [Nocardia brasiliensis]|uniref:protein phosphatase 2C domain-containing protein n=1 Tax=Nocardia brasiliensis TaxID=37326 RepID=UPI002454F28F|nr:protein phosphatase 2C domain-containing protein [Nocardia brasiliensis]
MNVATAQLPSKSNEDRVLTAASGVIVLDGATSFDSAAPAGAYVDVLGDELCRRLSGADDLREALSGAIAATADRLSIRAGHAPSCTVAMLRLRPNALDILVLGDSPVVVGMLDGSHHVLADERLERLDLPESDQYRNRLRSGAGYDDAHRGILRSLQRQQRQRRNRAGGYWIAEADPTAAHHAIVEQLPPDDVSWVILATDGAAEPLVPLGVTWPEIADLGPDALSQLLDRCQQWEAHTDPDGQLQPRAKRHDDKTIAVVRLPQRS